MVKYSVVTTFNNDGYHRYGSRMIDTFLTNWPASVELKVYAEDCKVDQRADNLHVVDFAANVPALVRFKNEYRNDLRATGRMPQGPMDRKGKQPGIGFKWDAVRFSHKVYAVCDAAMNWPSDVMFWMDADTICHSPVTRDFIDSQIPESIGIAYLGRTNKYSECGLYALNLRDLVTREFIKRFQSAYDDAENGIFKMAEWHDSFVFDRIREATAQQHPQWNQLDWSAGLIDGEGHPLINSQWGAYLDHLKGDRKNEGKSRRRDLKGPRLERYWQC